MPRKPWWVRIKGGENAIRGMANFSSSTALRNAWLIQNRTRLKENPELAAAVTSANVPYALARRIDLAFQAGKAEKQQSIETTAGRSPAMQDPVKSQPAQAQRSAQPQVRKEDVQGSAGIGAFLGGLWAGLTRSPNAPKEAAAVTTEFASNRANNDVPLWQQLAETATAVPKAASETVWDLGKGAVEGLGWLASAAQSPFSAPLAAGAADAGAPLTDAGGMSWIQPTDAGRNLIHGVGKIHGGVNPTQAQDMRKGGYDPDSWWDRYQWYGNFSGDNDIVSERAVKELKTEFDPHKVDLAREIFTVGVFEHPDRFNGLSPDAQRLFDSAVVRKEDKEAGRIFKVLADRSAVTLGGHVADRLGLELGNTDRQVVSAVADLAAYWFIDPAVVAGKAFTAFRDARYAIGYEPQAIKEAIVNTRGGSNRIANRWDGALDRIDRIHVLSNTPTAEAQAQVAKETVRFQQAYGDMMPFYDTLLGMRNGSITGTFFKDKFDAAPSLRDPKDFNPVGIHRESDPTKYSPIFSLRQNIDDNVTQSMRDAARAEIADRLADAIYANAMIKGEPLTNPQFLMPGQFRTSNVIRVPLQKMTDKLLGQNGKLLDQLKAAEGKGLIDFSSPNWRGDVAGVLDSAKGGQWIRENYTRNGMRDRAAMTLSRFATVRDADILHIDRINSAKTYHDFVRFFMPRGHAAFATTQWARADPATRSAMVSSLIETIANARHLKDGKVGLDYWRQQLKGREAPILPGEHAKEAYSSPDVDIIDTPSGRLAAAMYSTQFAPGIQLPSFVEIIRNTEKVGVLSVLAGLSHSRFVDAFTRVGKVSQVGTTSNAMRQITEGRGLQAMDDPLGATHAAIARLGLAGSNAALRVELNDAIRQARKLASSGKMDQLTPLVSRKRFDEYADTATTILGGKVSPHLDAWMRAGAPIEQIIKGRSAARLAATKLLADPFRRARAKIYAPIARRNEPFAFEWLDRVEDGFADRLRDNTSQYLGSSTAHWMDGAMVDELNQVREGVEAGQRLAQVKLRNTQEYLGAAGDAGVLRWNNALGLRLSDPVGGQVLQAVAREALGNPVDPVDLARRLLTDDPAGEAYRLYGRRGQYINGEYVGGTADQMSALRGWADQMVDDARRYLGLESPGALSGAVDPGHAQFLSKLASGKQLTADDLAKVTDDFRPEQVHAPVVVGRKFIEPGGFKSIPDKASKIYNFVVAGPIRRLVHDPQVVAAHHEAMITMEPLARVLNAKGMSAENIYKNLDTMAYGHAIGRVTRYSDDPHVTSYFATLANNFLWYERATEDFARRAIRITKADPAKVARAVLMAEAAHHSGMLYEQRTTTDDGNAEREWMFTWPGSGWFTRTMNEGLRSLGIVDEDIVKVPVWQDWASPVKYLSPSLQNPLGFTTTPLVGLPMRTIKAIWPETTPDINTVLTNLEGGERHFGSANIVESLMPVYMRRAWNAIDQDERDSQVASATRNALVYLQAAGKLPGPDASPAERERALDDVRLMTQNLTIWRAAFAMFAPATPGTMVGNISGIGDEQLNEIDQLRGINSIRGEWFQLLEDFNQRYPQDSSRAFSEAATEWARRDMGSILQPQAFSVGSSGAPGWETGKSGPSNMDVTQWMLDNRHFLRDYGAVGHAMIPSLGEAYYNKVGYETQLRTGVRQHKDLQEFYEDLVIAQANSLFFAKLDERSAALDKAGDNRDARNKINNEFNRFADELKRAHPVWAEQHNKQNTVEYVAANIAPAVRRLADDTDAPDTVKPHQAQLKQLADLYDEYRTALAKYPGTKYADASARKGISIRYGQLGKERFADGPLGNLWKLMRTFED